MRELLVVRHAIALDRYESVAQGMDDTQRPLTEEGKEKMLLAARGIKACHPKLDAIFSSALVRARQTTELLSSHYPGSTQQIVPQLSPEYSVPELIDVLTKVEANSVAIVGHEPQLRMLIAALLCADEYAGIVLKKGGAAKLRFHGRVAEGEGQLQWLLTPKQLRLTGKSA